MSRWDRIEESYKIALEAERTCPGTPLRDVFRAVAKDKGRAIIATAFYPRSEHPGKYHEFARKHPNCTIYLDANCTPYRPRKGELTFKEWKGQAVTESAIAHSVTHLANGKKLEPLYGFSDPTGPVGTKGKIWRCYPHDCKCRECGAVFKASRRDARFCSAACRKRDSRRAMRRPAVSQNSGGLSFTQAIGTAIVW